jgi:hypothetical protein
MPGNNLDIEEFIDTELEARIETGKLSIGNPAILLEIPHALSSWCIGNVSVE